MGGSPVMLVVHRRLRAAKKKLTRIQELESAQTNGKQLNTDQVGFAHTSSRHGKLTKAEISMLGKLFNNFRLSYRS